jgi:hypothetical protein
MKLSLEGRPKFAEKRDEPPLWAPDYYPEVLEVGFEDMQVYKAPLAFRSPRSPFVDRDNEALKGFRITPKSPTIHNAGARSIQNPGRRSNSMG